MTAASIMDGVSRVLRDPGYRRRAEGIRDCIRAAPGLQQALTWIQDFAKGAAGSH
jgi:UDP:flavonoid glycosyltransferase YjiC (YdhE family)